MLYDLKFYSDLIYNSIKEIITNPKVILDTADGNKVGGYIVSEYFSGLSQDDRQDRLCNLPEGSIDKLHIDKINALLTMTPEEIE